MRRSSFVIGALAWSALTLAGCGPTASGGASDTPILFQWEDYMEAPFLAGYKNAFGETPQVSIFADEDEAFAKMRAGFAPDVMGPCYYEYPRWQDAGLIQPIDTTKLKNWNKISPSLGTSEEPSEKRRISPRSK
jgi:spermidine/putrescine-binding protein